MASIASRQPERGGVCDTYPAEDAFVIISIPGGSMKIIYLMIVPVSIFATHLMAAVAVTLSN